MFQPFSFFGGPPVPEASPYFTTTLDGNIHLSQVRRADGRAYTETRTINIDSNLDAINSFIKFFIQHEVKKESDVYKTEDPGADYLRYHGLDKKILRGKYLEGDTMRNLVNFLRAYTVSRAAGRRLSSTTFIHRDSVYNTEEWMLTATDTIGVTDENELLFESSLLEILGQYLNNNNFFYLLHHWVFPKYSPIYFKVEEDKYVSIIVLGATLITVSTDLATQKYIQAIPYDVLKRALKDYYKDPATQFGIINKCLSSVQLTDTEIAGLFAEQIGVDDYSLLLYFREQLSPFNEAFSFELVELLMMYGRVDLVTKIFQDKILVPKRYISKTSVGFIPLDGTSLKKLPDNYSQDYETIMSFYGKANLPSDGGLYSIINGSDNLTLLHPELILDLIKKGLLKRKVKLGTIFVEEGPVKPFTLTAPESFDPNRIDSDQLTAKLNVASLERVLMFRNMSLADRELLQKYTDDKYSSLVLRGPEVKELTDTLRALRTAAQSLGILEEWDQRFSVSPGFTAHFDGETKITLAVKNKYRDSISQLKYMVVIDGKHLNVPLRRAPVDNVVAAIKHYFTEEPYFIAKTIYDFFDEVPDLSIEQRYDLITMVYTEARNDYFFVGSRNSYPIHLRG